MPHPLESEDYSIVQDHLVTRIALLATTGSEHDEWDRELLAIRHDSADAWGHHVAFLLDFTLARFVALALRESVDLVSDEWSTAFVTAVSDQDYLIADEVWASANRAAAVRDDGLLETTRALRRLIPTGRLVPTGLDDELPPEYYPAMAS